MSFKLTRIVCLLRVRSGSVNVSSRQTPWRRCSGAKRSNGATRARNVRRYGYSASRAPCHTVLLGAASAVFQPRGQAIPKVGIIKKVARSIQSNATVQVLPGLAGDVPSPSLIMRAKGQQNVKANGA